MADDIYACSAVVGGKEFAMIGFSTNDMKDSYFLDFIFLTPYSKGKDKCYNIEKAFYSSDDKLGMISARGGDLISENIVYINKLREDKGEAVVFKYTSKTAMGFINMSSIVCTSNSVMGTLIDNLYFMFYENLKRIKTFIGGGDEKVGDQIIREDDLYQCIFNVKTIRTDFRHDVDHGGEKSIRKKYMSIGDCYKFYCKRRPIKAKDFKLLQLGLYNDLLKLTEKLIEQAVGEFKD